jgi:hypothetical protein
MFYMLFGPEVVKNKNKRSAINIDPLLKPGLNIVAAKTVLREPRCVIVTATYE